MEPFKVKLLKIDVDEKKLGFNTTDVYDVLLMVQEEPRFLRPARFGPALSERPESTKNILPNQAVLGDDDEDEEPRIINEKVRIVDVLFLIASKKTGNYLWVNINQTKYLGSSKEKKCK